MKIITNHQEIEYQGFRFPFFKVKERIKQVVPEQLYRDRCIHQRFNPETGLVDRKYAWSSVFEDLAEVGVLQAILGDILEEENYFKK